MTTEIQPAPTFDFLTPTQLFERMLRLSVADGDASPKTVKIYRIGLTMFLSWADKIPLDPLEASYDHIQEYRRWLVDQNYSRGTVSLRLTAVRTLYAGLQRWGKRPDNPASGVRSPKDRESRASKIAAQALSPDEARRLLACLPVTIAPQDLRDRAMLILMLYHGLRAFEVSGLRARDFDYRTFTDLRVMGKGRKERTIAISPEARGAIYGWVSRNNDPVVDGSNPHLFYRLDVEGQRPLSVRSVERIVDKYLTKAGLKQHGRCAHALRHTSAMLACLGGASLQALAESMGHANIATTDGYARAAAKYQHNPSDAVTKALKQSEVTP